MNPTHPSRLLSISDDVEPVHHDVVSTAPLDPVALQQRFPLHSAIANNKTDSIVETIRQAHTEDPSSIHRGDENGFQPIFVAVIIGNVAAVRALVALGVQEDLIRRDNTDGLTVREICDREMHTSREFQETLIGKWAGYTNNQLQIHLMIKRAMGDEVQETDDEYLAARKWGCSCGKCVDGWLSPMMLYRLQRMRYLQKVFHSVLILFIRHVRYV